MVEVDRTVLHMKDEAANFPDPNDRATQEEEFSLELRTRDRERKLIRKIDEALKRIEDGSYGYCLETGEEIGIKRLEARPVATLSVEAQERRERREKQYGDRDDQIPLAPRARRTARLCRTIRSFADRRSAPGVAVHRGGELSRRARQRRALAVAHRGCGPAARGPGIRRAASCATLRRSASNGMARSCGRRIARRTMRPPSTRCARAA